MTMPKSYDTVLRHLRDDAPRKGDVGIEIEAEGPHGGSNPAQYWERNRMDSGSNPKFWQIKEDHSLRNGLEYVSRGPIPVDHLETALSEWSSYTKGSKFRQDSIRTSVHYHVNVSDLTLNQILAAIVGYWLIETPLVDTQGPTRVGNLFCLRVSDADYIVNDLINSLESALPLFDGNLSDNVKYAALNLNTVRRFGSLEFRFCKGTTDPKEIQQWAEFLYGMVHRFAALKTPSGVVRFIEDKGTMAFFNMVTTGHPWLKSQITYRTGWMHAIESNYSYAYMVHSKLEDLERMHSMKTEVITSRKHLFAFDPDGAEIEGMEYTLPECQPFSPDEEEMPKTIFRKKQGKRGYLDHFLATMPPTGPQTPPPMWPNAAPAPAGTAWQVQPGAVVGDTINWQTMNAHPAQEGTNQVLIEDDDF